MILIALLVPVVLLLMMFALDVFENYLFPPPEPPPPNGTVPEDG